MKQGEEINGTIINEEQLEHQKTKKKKHIKLRLILFNCLLVCIGQVIGPLLLRLYFMHGGQRKWLSSWLQTAAFPILLVPPVASWARSRSQVSNNLAKLNFILNPKLFIASVFLGILFGLDSFLFATGLSYLPASTSALLMSTQLAFTSVFALALVRQKFTPFSINSILLMTLGSVILGFHTSGDRPPGVSKVQYFIGFFMTLGAAALLGFTSSFMQLMYTKACKAITYHLVLQVQFVVCLVATIFCTVGMIINNDFQAMPREAKEYGLGKGKYYLVLVMAAICMQCLVVGNLGVVFCSTALFSGVFSALLVPVQQIFAVIFFHEKFSAEKGMSLALSLWGFVSYFFGEYKLIQKQKKKLVTTQLESPTAAVV